MDLSFGYGVLGNLPKIRNCRVRRVSSYVSGSQES